ncbi:MAG: NUDIX hydrolase [Bacteroidetes bacterium]|nr:MAG: NUDIX hydrolase [Bacteroidota bacterium]
MAQIYKVFKDNTAFFITNNTNSINNNRNEIIRINKAADIIEIISNKSIGNPESTIIIQCDDFDNAIEVMEKHYIPKVAAGGWVYNEKGQLLFIKRWDIWDIPKGHLEKGETLEECAIREVEEETGINNIKIVEKLGISRHIFSKNGKEKLKVTHWYKMQTSFNGELRPQLEEDIKEVKWVENSNIDSYLEKSWKSLKEFYFSNIR